MALALPKTPVLQRIPAINEGALMFAKVEQGTHKGEFKCLIVVKKEEAEVICCKYIPAKNWNTSGVWSHLKVHHVSIHAQLKQWESDQAEQEAEDHAKRHKGLQQQNLFQCLGKHRKNKEVLRLHRALANFAAKSHTSNRAVTMPWFKEMLEAYSDCKASNLVPSALFTERYVQESKLDTARKLWSDWSESKKGTQRNIFNLNSYLVFFLAQEIVIS